MLLVDAIKLGGIGILTWDEGKVKTRKVGRRATGTGAKWGVALGAITGILSGGVTLIGGAIAGAAGGAVLGSLRYKNLGLTDEDKAWRSGESRTARSELCGAWRPISIRAGSIHFQRNARLPEVLSRG